MKRPLFRFVARLAEHDRGAAAVEFALVALPAIIIMCGLFDLGFRQYVATQVQDSLDRAARKVTIGTSTTSDQLTAMVKDRVTSVIKGASVDVAPASYTKYQQIAKAEPITTDTPPLGVYNQGDCFSDINRNGVWDADAGKAGTGGSDDVVVYVATVTYPELLPMRKLVGGNGISTIKASTMVKNQPYAAQPEAMTICS
ncbi:pilus assembly protein [Sphingomonas sp. LR60]|uniref:TadE/TadG family type IV pilus assembly protein n=1 Tax=Sphingomonas sp. LR60 TaxID=3050233 RepID=UPI002FE02F57